MIKSLKSTMPKLYIKAIKYLLKRKFKDIQQDLT